MFNYEWDKLDECDFNVIFDIPSLSNMYVCVPLYVVIILFINHILLLFKTMFHNYQITNNTEEWDIDISEVCPKNSNKFSKVYYR